MGREKNPGFTSPPSTEEEARDPFSQDALRERIKAHAPAAPPYQDGVAKLLDDLSQENYGEPGDVDSYTFVLVHIDMARATVTTEDARTTKAEHQQDLVGYRKKHAKLQRKLEELHQEEPLLQYVRWEFYEPDDVYCRHDRPRKVCERLGAEHARRVVDQALRDKDVKGAVPRMRERLALSLKQTGDDFCQAPFGAPAPVDWPHRGRPPAELQNALLDPLMPFWEAAGWRPSKGIRYIARILAYCFGHGLKKKHLGPDDTVLDLYGSVTRLWNRRKGKAS